MLHLQLYIEGQLIEMFKDESITLTQNIVDVKNLDSVLTDYSRTFTVPASKRNNKVFKHFYNYNIDGFNAKIKKSSVLEINFKPFKTGKVRFEGVTLKNNKPQSYKLTFFGDTIKLPDLLGEDQISTLTELSAFDFSYNDTTVGTYMTDGLDVEFGTEKINEAIIFPLISHTSRLTYDSTADEIYNLFPSVGSDSNGVPFSELKPALRIHAIVKAIELHYSIDFSEDFFNDQNSGYYDLYMWLHTKPGALFQDQNKTTQFKGYNLTGEAQDELLIRSNNFAINNSKNHIVFNLGFTVNPGDVTAQYSLVIKQNGKDFRRFENLTGSTKNGTATNVESDLIEIENGEFSVFIESSAATTFDLDIFVQRQNNGFLGGKKDCVLDTSITTISDANFTVCSNIPEMKIIDFLKGLFKMFNLVAYVKDEVIVVKTLDEYYKSSTKIHNITEYVDSTQSQVDTPIPFRQINLGYEENKTFLAKNFKNINNRSWGKAEYTEDSYVFINGEKSKHEGETYEIKIPFEHMLFERLHDLSDDSETSIQWGWHVDEKEQKSVEKPLLFYTIRSISSIAAINLSGTKVTINSPYLPSNSAGSFLSYFKDSMSQSINFHAEIDEFSRVPNEQTLFESFYKDYIKDLFDERKRITKLTAELPLKIHESLSLADEFKIFDRIYRINSITTNFETGKSELELTNILKEATVEVPILQAFVQIDTGGDEITVDSTILTVDQENSDVDEFSIPPIIDANPETILQNFVINKTINECEVTKAIASDPKTTGTANSIMFNYTITHSGQVCDIDNIDEFGFLISETKSDLTSSDFIDTLKGDSNITVINTVRSSGSPTLQEGEKYAIISGLTHEAKRYARFYVKTNTDARYNEANLITSVFEGVTDQGQQATATTSKEFRAKTAGYGNSGGYSTIPDLITIQQNSQRACGTEIFLDTYFHNGSGAIPTLNDRVKSNESGKTYAGGSSSVSSEFTTENYYVLALSTEKQSTADIQAEINKFLVIDQATAKVVKEIDCLTPGTLVNAIIASSYFAPLQSSNLKRSCGADYSWKINNDFKIAHNGSGVNPQPGDQVKFTHTLGSENLNVGFNGDQSNFPFSTSMQSTFGKFDYHTLLLSDSEGIIRGIITIEKFTGSVINTFYCD